MGWPHCCCVRFSDTYTMDDRYFYCYYDTVAVTMCATSRFNTDLVAYRYVQIIKVFLILSTTYSLPGRPYTGFFSSGPSCMFAFVAFITWTIFRSVNLEKLGARSHNRTASSSQCPGGLHLLPFFLLLRPSILICPRRRSRWSLSLMADMIFLFDNASSVLREAAVAIRLAYVSGSLDVAAARIAMASIV